MVIYSQYKLNEIPSINYLVMAEDGNPTDRRLDGWTTPNLYQKVPRPFKFERLFISYKSKIKDILSISQT